MPVSSYQVNFKAMGDGSKPLFFETPTWKADTSDPVIGDGILRSSWYMDENILNARIMLKWGTTTTTTSSGIWYFNIPNGMQADYRALGITDVTDANTATAKAVIGTGWVEDVGTSFYGILALIEPSSRTAIRMVQAGTASNFVRSTVPHTWGSLDCLTLDIRVPVLY